MDKQEKSFLEELNQNDCLETFEREKIDEQLAIVSKRREKYEQIQSELESSGALQISTSDSDARALLVRRNIVEVGYNT